MDKNLYYSYHKARRYYDFGAMPVIALVQCKPEIAILDREIEDVTIWYILWCHKFVVFNSSVKRLQP